MPDETSRLPFPHTKRIELNVTQDAAVAAMCDDLQKMVGGLSVLGLQAHLIERVIKKLNDQSKELGRFRSNWTYIVGHNDGWEAAFATGLPGEDAE